MVTFAKVSFYFCRFSCGISLPVLKILSCEVFNDNTVNSQVLAWQCVNFCLILSLLFAGSEISY